MRERKTVRLAGFDYSSAEKYFITICTYLKEPLLGRMVDDHIMLTDIGAFAHKVWTNIGNIYCAISVEEFIIMPNHLHGILSFKELDEDNGAKQGVSDVIRNFKAFTGHEYYTSGPNRKLWQRGYHEHIIRDDFELDKIKMYIRNNPLSWSVDKYYLI